MSLEIRPITAGEVEQAELIVAQAFNDRRPLSELVERANRLFLPDWTLAAFDDGVMTSMTRIIPAQMRINGGALSFGAVSPVANSPFQRRKGHTGVLLRQSLAHMRQQGQVLSGLYTPHPAFYRRYGWEVAGDGRRYEFKPKDLKLTVRPQQRGSLRPVKPDAWLELDAVFQQATRLSTGPFVRDEFWWSKWIFGSSPSQRLEAVLWQDDTGTPQGYLLAVPGNTPDGWAGRVSVLELIALTGDAHLNLLQYLASLDIFRDITLRAPSNDPLPLLFADGERLEISQRLTVMLRVIDLKAALEARPTANPGLNTSFTLQVADDTAAWNQGSWSVAVKAGATSLDKIEGSGEISVHARLLGPLLTGYISPRSAALAGLLQASSDDALSRADEFFRTLARPHFPDSY
ncbi:MAG TPA: GNAT family N-acetyltransferase [Dehalococcoidia bacterium]|nr:GNAT family N-acetyltransferase [Dehalococcoidia bacterium]